MNIENLKKVRDAVANSRAFRMCSWASEHRDDDFIGGHYCGSSACIAGHAGALMFRERAYGSTPISTYKTVCAWLELDELQANSLFFPVIELDGFNMTQIFKDHAVRCLDHLIETGEVDWMRTA